MPTSYSDRLRVALQATGDNPSTWGAIANQAVFELLDDAIAGVESIIVGGSNITLTTANGSEDQARKAVLKLSGVISADINLVVPNEEKVYFIDAGFTGTNTLTVKPTSGSGIGFTTGQRGVVYCDGVNVILITKDFDSSTLGDLAFLDTITSTGLLANGIVTTSILATGAVTASVLAPGIVDQILPVQTSANNKLLSSNATSVVWKGLEVNVTTYTAGSHTYTVPSNLLYCVVEVQGAGGSKTSGSNGCGAGGYARKTFNKSALTSTVAVTVGNVASGANGGASTFGSYITANGGQTAGQGGTATGGDINITGGCGQTYTNPSLPFGGGSPLAPMTAFNFSPAGYGAGASGLGGLGTAGIVIITEYKLI